MKRPKKASESEKVLTALIGQHMRGEKFCHETIFRYEVDAENHRLAIKVLKLSLRKIKTKGGE